MSYLISKPESAKELFVIDGGLPDIPTLIEAIGADKWIVVLDSQLDGVWQLAELFSPGLDLNAIHVLSHGAAGSVTLGSAVLDNASLPNYTMALQKIGHALTPNGDLLLYGCDVGRDNAFATALASATGADVAASDDLTGTSNAGADWFLETDVGSIEFDTISSNTLGAYDHTLGAVPQQSLSYDLGTFSDLAALSACAYKKGDELIHSLEIIGWSYVGQYEQGDFDSHAICAERIIDGKRELVISFEGTTTKTDWWTDVKWWGFTNYYKSLRDEVVKWIEKGIIGEYEILNPCCLQRIPAPRAPAHDFSAA